MVSSGPGQHCGTAIFLNCFPFCFTDVHSWDNASEPDKLLPRAKRLVLNKLTARLLPWSRGSLFYFLLHRAQVMSCGEFVSANGSCSKARPGISWKLLGHEIILTSQARDVWHWRRLGVKAMRSFLQLEKSLSFRCSVLPHSGWWLKQRNLCTKRAGTVCVEPHFLEMKRFWSFCLAREREKAVISYTVGLSFPFYLGNRLLAKLHMVNQSGQDF